MPNSQLHSSTAPQLHSSTAPQLHRFVCSCIASLLVVFAVAGCDRPVAGTSSEAGGVVQQVPSAVDAGVVFIDRESYLCLGVLIDFQLNDGATHRVTVNLLHTTIAEEDSL